MNTSLNIFLYGVLVGKLEDKDNQISFAYQSSWLTNENAIPISQSLPLTADKYDEKACLSFFEGLLPEGEARQTIAQLFNVSENNYYGILHHIGEDCAGALTVLPEKESFVEPSKFTFSSVLNDELLYEKIMQLPVRPLLAGEQGIRISLAGVQRKLPVFRVNDEIHLPLGHTPSTHIIKPPIERFEQTTENEYFCMLLANKMNLNAAQVEMKQVKTMNVLIVERYDRSEEVSPGKGIIFNRIHQEDFCQAKGVLSRYKYENEGGPSLADCFEMVDQASAIPAKDRQSLLKALFFNYCIGNNDAHGKNFSLLYTQKKIHLAPLYDLLSTLVYIPDDQMAMSIGNKYKADRVYKKHWVQFSKDINMNATILIKQLKEFVQRLKKEALNLELELKANGVEAEVFGEIIKIINHREQHIRAY